VIVQAEDRLSDVAAALAAKHATHCAVLDPDSGQFLGIVRLLDLALRPSQRLFADLVAAEPVPQVPETAAAAEVVAALRAGAAEEVVVVGADGRYRGIVTREGLLEWALREQDQTQKKLEAEIASREETLRQQTEHLRQALREAERYATFASHDLRTPLRSIHWYADILLESSPSLDAAGRGYLDRIRNASKRMDALLEGFLEESRLVPAREGELITDLDVAVDEAIEHCERLIAERDARIAVAKPLYQVRGRPAVVVRILANLLANAIKHAPGVRTPIVQFCSEVDEARVYLSIRDNGAGMPSPYLIGLPHSAAKAGAETQGLGLLIVERAVNRLGGGLALVSSPGEGSTFTVSLPRANIFRP